MTTTRDRERLDAVAMKTQRMDNSVAPVTGAERQLGARDVLVNSAGISLDSKLPNSAGVEASAVCVRRTKED
jgi:NADP-dependent 3-hydroxy acid dehydrogenase YdfG